MRLSHLLIIKLSVELIFISALAINYYVKIEPPGYQGWSEITPEGIAGWVADGAQDWRAVEMQLYVDDVFFASTNASLPRPDVVALRRTKDERCGFNFKLKTLADGLHAGRVFAVHTTTNEGPKSLIPIGPKLRFRVRVDRENRRMASE